MTDSTTPLLCEDPNRYDIQGLNVINRESGEVEAYVSFTRGEIDMPGYVEHVERGYENTPWRAERTTEPRPADL